jgi:hypothetical protein
MTKVEYHCHTSSSHDCKVTFLERVEEYSERGFTHIAITDHDRVLEPEYLRQITGPKAISIIPGIEVSTFLGHIILLNCNSKPLFNDPVYLLLISFIKGSVIYIPHPMRSGTGFIYQCNKKRIPFWYQELILKRAQYIEVYNHRDPKLSTQEISVKSLSILKQKRYTAASDAHSRTDIYNLGCPLEGLNSESCFVENFFNACVPVKRFRLPSWRVPFSYIYLLIKYQINVN